MTGYSKRGSVPGVDIVNLFSRKVGDYLNISINVLSTITNDTIIKLYFVRPTVQQEPELNIHSKTLPDPYLPNPSDYFLMLSYNDPFLSLPVDITSTIIGNNILKFSMHLGVLENDHGIGYGVDFGLFAQAFRTITDSDNYDYFAYDSIGLGAADAPLEVISNLLTSTECLFDESDVPDDDYGYNLKFKTPDRAAGVKLVSTSRTSHPEIDIIKITCERVGFYFEVTLSLAAKVSNDTAVRYTLYLVEPNHTETGIHLTPNQLTDDNYPIPYSPGSNEKKADNIRYELGYPLRNSKTYLVKNHNH